MPARILFLTNSYACQQTLDALGRIQPACETAVEVYDSFQDIPRIFGRLSDNYDAVMISGTSAKYMITLSYPHIRKPVVAYQVDSDGLHRDILRLAIETQNLDFSRIAVDFMIPLGSGYSVVDFLACEDMGMFIRSNDALTASVQEAAMCSMETVVLEGILALWEQNAIDQVLCLYASIVPELQKRGIPFRCPFISDRHLEQLIQEVLIRVELQQSHENHPAIIQLFPRNTSSATPEQMSRLRYAVEQYLHSIMIHCIVQQNQTSCVVITTLRILRPITDSFRNCHFSAYLQEHLDFPVNVAYGIGTSVPHAMNNVQIASKEARLLNQPFVVDSNGNLIGPLGSEKRMVITAESMPDISQIAKRCNLSAMTIQRIISIMQCLGSDKITTPELAARMSTTLRNANRIMLNLCKGNVAAPVYTQTSHSRGRPIQVYSLNFD